jgi:DNA-binding MarR family transcriptional regulator
MTTPDEVIHQSLRLRIMATINALPAKEQMEFTRLRAILGATDGNLGAHVTILENAGYIAVEKDFVARRARRTQTGKQSWLADIAGC